MTQKTSPINSYNTFLDVYLEELLGAPDTEILEGLEPAAEKAAGLKLFEAAKAEAGRRRLARAREAIAKSLSRDFASEVSISPTEARAFVRAAMNDPRFTVAARQLDELSDEDVLRVYAQIKELQSSNEDGSNAKR